MAKSDYCVIGLGRFGVQLSTRLYEMGKNVMVIDINQEAIQKASSMHELCIKCNATDINSLIDTGIQNVKTVIVAISSIETSILVCANLREIGMNDIIAKATNVIHERVLKTMGIPRVVIPDIEVANRTALQCVYNLGADITSIGAGLSWIKTVVTNQDVVGISFIELNFKEKYGATIIMIQRKDKIIFPPDKDTKFLIGDIASVMCRTEKIANIIKVLSKEVYE